MAFETPIGTLDFKRAEEHYAKADTLSLHYARADAALAAKVWDQNWRKEPTEHHARLAGKYLDEVSVIVQEITKRRKKLEKR